MTDQIWKLCTVCEGNGVVKIPGGVSQCDHCHGTCYESPPQRPDGMSQLAALVAALEGYLAAKGRGELAWMAAFNRLLHALAAAKRALEQA
jgi:hypothetical protein